MNESWSILGFYNQFLEETKKPQEQTDFWRGSDMGYCLRKRFYYRQGIERTEELTARELRIFEIGNLYHRNFQRFIRQLGLEIESEGEITNEEYNFRGHFDLLAGGIPQEIDKKHFMFYSEKEKDFVLFEKNYQYCLKKREELLTEFPQGLPYILYEFKTQHSASFSYLTESAQPQHVLQISSYLHFIKDKYPQEINGRIVYISKDDGRTEEFNIILTPELEEKIKDELQLLQDKWQKNELPDQLPEFENKRINWQCKWCPFLTHCRGGKWLKEMEQKQRSAKINNKK